MNNIGGRKSSAFKFCQEYCLPCSPKPCCHMANCDNTGGGKIYDTNKKPHFYFTSPENVAYRYCLQNIAKKWATYRQKLWYEFYDPTMRREVLMNNVPEDVPRDQWACFVNYRLKPSTIELCRKNKENRNKQIILHTCGSKSNSQGNMRCTWKQVRSLVEE
ncbi:hypothetical protein PIB30_020349 [Stylosanthes scabra]|uniref:Uncharacterized protein n=1 Tax=Stylosanthes scabra TaxID=79078 RepID=A0ABU6ZA83_9FABA|nr:hypothetical protein [Stylosanthes scabra]